MRDVVPTKRPRLLQLKTLHLSASLRRKTTERKYCSEHWAVLTGWELMVRWYIWSSCLLSLVLSDRTVDWRLKTAPAQPPCRVLLSPQFTGGSGLESCYSRHHRGNTARSARERKVIRNWVLFSALYGSHTLTVISHHSVTSQWFNYCYSCHTLTLLSFASINSFK